jgi:hypothetical protein
MNVDVRLGEHVNMQQSCGQWSEEVYTAVTLDATSHTNCPLTPNLFLLLSVFVQLSLPAFPSLVCRANMHRYPAVKQGIWERKGCIARLNSIYLELFLMMISIMKYMGVGMTGEADGARLSFKVHKRHARHMRRFSGR